MELKNTLKKNTTDLPGTLGGAGTPARRTVKTIVQNSPLG